MNSAPASIRHQLNSIHDYITAFESILESGRMTEMVGLEQRVAEVCEAIKMADEATKGECLLELKELLKRINSCEERMRSLFDKTRSPANSHD